MEETLNTRVTRLEKNMAEMSDLVKILLHAQIETEKKFRETDERIEKLVSAIGELIQHMPRNGRSSA